MFENIKKKMTNPNLLVLIFYGVAALVILERTISLGYTLAKTEALKTAWHPVEYTLALMLPLAGFAYFCSSKYAANTENKIKMYVITYIFLALLFFCMLSQAANELVWYLLSLLGISAQTVNAATLPKLTVAVRAFTLYVPLCIIPPSLPPILEFLFDNNNHPVNKLKGLSIIETPSPKKKTVVPECDVALCKDLTSGEPVMLTEARRMEAVLIQGATGTGKTSTLMLPMGASDLEKKYQYKETAKSIAFQALKDGIAYVNAPYDNKTLNEYFSLGFIAPVVGKEKEYEEMLGNAIKCKDEQTGRYCFRDVGITVLEPDGKYIEDFRAIAANFGIPVYIIDPMDPNSLGINPFINKSPAKVASIISTVLKGMYESENPDSGNLFFGQVTQQALENLAILLKVMYPKMHDGEIPTLEDMLKMLYDYSLVEDMCEEMKKDPVLGQKHSILIKYFEKNFYQPPLDINGRPVPGSVGSNRRETEQFLYGATTQLDNLMRNKAVRKVLCSRDNNIDLDRVLAEGHCVTVCTRRGELSALLSKPFGMFYILTMQDAVLRRPGDENTRIPHFFYIDEFPDFVNKESETCFTLFRKYRCGMIIAIQNLSQLERTKAMRYYKEVITTNCKSVVVFGDTNAEDSNYWSKSFGRHEYWDIGNNMEIAPLANVNSPKDTGVGGEAISMKIAFTENIKPWMLNELPFKQVYYRTRTGKGKQVFGRGSTDFVDKRFLKTFERKEYEFEKYVTYMPDMSRTGPALDDSPTGIIEQEELVNTILTRNSGFSPLADNEEVNRSAEDIVISNIEYIDDTDIEIEKNVAQ